MKRCSTSSPCHQGNANSKQYHYKPIRTAKIQNTQNTRWWQICGSLETLTHCWWKSKIVQPLWKTVWGFFRKLNSLTVQSSNCTPGYLPKGAENLCPHKTLHAYVYKSFIYNCHNLEAPKMPYSRWMNKLWYIQTMKYYLALKRNELSSHEKIRKNLKCI